MGEGQGGPTMGEGWDQVPGLCAQEGGLGAEKGELWRFL